MKPSTPLASYQSALEQVRLETTRRSEEAKSLQQARGEAETRKASLRDALEARRISDARVPELSLALERAGERLGLVTDQAQTELMRALGPRFAEFSGLLSQALAAEQAAAEEMRHARAEAHEEVYQLTRKIGRIGDHQDYLDGMDRLLSLTLRADAGPSTPSPGSPSQLDPGVDRTVAKLDAAHRVVRWYREFRSEPLWEVPDQAAAGALSKVASEGATLADRITATLRGTEPLSTLFPGAFEPPFDGLKGLALVPVLRGLAERAGSDGDRAAELWLKGFAREVEAAQDAVTKLEAERTYASPAQIEAAVLQISETLAKGLAKGPLEVPMLEVLATLDPISIRQRVHGVEKATSKLLVLGNRSPVKECLQQLDRSSALWGLRNARVSDFLLGAADLLDPARDGSNPAAEALRSEARAIEALAEGAEAETAGITAKVRHGLGLAWDSLKANSHESASVNSDIRDCLLRLRALE